MANPKPLKKGKKPPVQMEIEDLPSPPAGEDGKPLFKLTDEMRAYALYRLSNPMIRPYRAISDIGGNKSTLTKWRNRDGFLAWEKIAITEPIESTIHALVPQTILKGMARNWHVLHMAAQITGYLPKSGATMNINAEAKAKAQAQAANTGNVFIVMPGSDEQLEEDADPTGGFAPVEDDDEEDL